jgi:hypothetical protein
MSNMLQGKRAVVFGASGSNGAAVAREFAAEGANATRAFFTFATQNGARTPRCSLNARCTGRFTC